ncbi:MAG: hypothetical protein ACT4RN_22765 [Pseudonocardia sp.]
MSKAAAAGGPEVVRRPRTDRRGHHLLTTEPEAAKLPDPYRLRVTRRNVEIRQIAGSPVIRDDTHLHECHLVLAVADTQLIGIDA